MFTIKNLLLKIGRNAIISIVIISITYILIFLINKETTRMIDKIALNNRLQTELNNRLKSLSSSEDDAKIIGTNDILIEKAFVPSNNISEFINALDKLASNNKITQTYSFQTPTPSPISGIFPLSTITYSNNLTSNISSLLSYLKDYEKLPYFAKIQSLKISSQDKAGWAGQSVMSLEANLTTKTVE